MLKPLVRALRPRQWVKNGFVLAPLVFAERLGDPAQVGRVLLAAALFCAASSAIYLINDIRDRAEDRLHPLKRRRPLASGELGVGTAATAAAVLLAAVVAIGAPLLTLEFLGVVALYVALQVVYSAGLKRVVILDVMAISAGFVLRVLGGAAAIQVDVSDWLLLCTTMLALFLAFSKRRHELLLLSDRAAAQRGVLSHYSPTFLDQMINVVTASTLIFYSLYVIDPETVARLGTDELILTLPMVLFGIFRYLYLMYQRPDERNPTEVIITDFPSVVNVALWGLAVVWILYG